jgi:YfiH family protein
MADMNDDAPRAATCPVVSGLGWNNVRYFTTTRGGGVSTGDFASLNLGRHTQDRPESVDENRRRLAGLLPARPLWLNQVHGIEVLDADAWGAHAGGPDSDPAGAAPTADAAVTTRCNRVLAIMTADCLPVVIAGEAGRVLGVAHAGWRGLASGVLEATLRTMAEKSGATAGGATAFRAWIGPAITQAHFEVGKDVHDAFVSADPSARGYFVRKAQGEKWLADLPALARHRLLRAGVANVELSGHCTYGRPDLFYSYRRGCNTGRIATLAWLAT